jgi:hypothetical protein
LVGPDAELTPTARGVINDRRGSEAATINLGIQRDVRISTSFT